MIGKNTHIFAFVCIVILGFLLRFIWLDRIPSAISGDELLYVLEAKSIWLTGKDISGSWNPLSVLFFHYPPDQLQAELPYLLNIPAIGLSHLTLITARLTSAIISVLSIVGLYFLTVELLSAPVALYVAFIAAINPWSIYIGRTAYDNVPAVCFYIWAMYMMVARKGKLFLWSLPLFVFAFYSYIGTKVVFIPLLMLSCVYAIKKYKNTIHKKHIIVLATFSMLFMSFYLYTIFIAHSSSRVSDIININDPSIAQTVDNIRKTSIRSELVDIFVNKYTIVISIILTKLFRIFSFDYLFTYGDKFYSMYTHGFFYFIDALFLIIGVLTMYVYRRKTMIYISILAFVSVIPHLIHTANTNDFSPHIAMMFPFLMVFIGYGIYRCVKRVDGLYRKLVIVGICLLYAVSLGNFLQQYWFQHPLSGQFDFPVRIMSKYVQIQNPNRQVAVYSPRTIDIYKKYLFYSDGITRATIPTIRKSLMAGDIRLGNISFLGCDAKLTLSQDTTVIYSSECGDIVDSASSLKITRLKDGGQEYRIYNDVRCLSYALKPYPSQFKIHDLAVERMSDKNFCEAYIIR